MAFFVPFVLGAAAAIAGAHVYKRYLNENSLCSCGCKENECDCEPDCDCECNQGSFLKKKVAGSAEFALEKVKSGLHVLENNITEENVDKVKAALQSAGSKIGALQEKLKDQPSA